MITGRKIAVWVVLGILGMAALGGAITGISLWASEGMRNVAHVFLGAVRSGQTDLAYGVTSARFRARVPPSSFPAWVQDHALNVRASASEWINGYSYGGGEACMEVWLTMVEPASPLPTNVYLELLREGDQWRIDDAAMTEPIECQSSD